MALLATISAMVSAMVFLAAPADAKPRPRVVIGKVASAEYLVDVWGDGSLMVPARTVTAVIHNCPKGFYWMSFDLTQHGVRAPWATSGRGANELTCDGRRRTVVRWPFVATDLHRGRARATFGLAPDGGPVTTISGHRVVRIPGRHVRARR